MATGSGLLGKVWLQEESGPGWVRAGTKVEGRELTVSSGLRKQTRQRGDPPMGWGIREGGGDGVLRGSHREKQGCPEVGPGEALRRRFQHCLGVTNHITAPELTSPPPSKAMCLKNPRPLGLEQTTHVCARKQQALVSSCHRRVGGSAP